MSLLQEMQTAAVESSADLGELLRRCKVLASCLNSEPLEQWIQWESEGYPDEESVPDYRVFSLEIKANFVGVAGSSLSNTPIATPFIPEEHREAVTASRCKMSVASLEAVLADAEGRSIRVGLGDLHLVLGMSVYQGYNCLQAWGELSGNQITEALNSVRNRILDFALAIEKEAPEAGSSATTPATITPERVTQIYNLTISGGNVSLVGLANHSQVANAVSAGNADELRAALAKLGVPQEDVLELEAALEADAEADDSAIFGPQTSSWLGNAARKALTGAWGIGADVATAALSRIVMNYCGIATDAS